MLELKLIYVSKRASRRIIGYSDTTQRIRQIAAVSLQSGFIKSSSSLIRMLLVWLDEFHGNCV